MIDSAILSYAHMLRINGWIGNLAAAAESELFGPASLTAKLDRKYGPKSTVRGLQVEELVQRLSEQLFPLLDRSNRMMLRNLKGADRAPAPARPERQHRSRQAGERRWSADQRDRSLGAG
jgi:hypothetical protein